MDTIDSDKISQKSRKSKDRNGSIPNNRISPRGSQVTLESSRLSQISEKVKCQLILNVNKNNNICDKQRFFFRLLFRKSRRHIIILNMTKSLKQHPYYQIHCQ